MTTKIYDMRDNWIEAQRQYTSVQMNTFDYASDINSRLMELKKNGVEQFAIDKFGEIIFGTLEIPRVNNLEEAISVLAGAGLAKVDIIAANNFLLASNNSMANNSVGLVYNDPVISKNDWYYYSQPNTTWVATTLLPRLADNLTPRKPVERTFYVTMTGNDNDANQYINQTSSTGMSIYKPFQTVGAALKAAANTGTWEVAAPNAPVIGTVANLSVLDTDAALPNGVPLDYRQIGDTYYVESEDEFYSWPGNYESVVIVHPGIYTIQPGTVIPRNSCLYGYDARVTKFKPPSGQEANNMLYLDSGCKVRGITFTGLRHEPEWLSTYGGSLDSGPPKKGYACSFKPGAFITRSPYVADCSVLHDLTPQQMSLPQRRETGNPDVPMTGGCLYADGSVVDTDSPLRSVVVDSFTAVNPNGVAYAIVENAIVQLVSIFTNWSRVGIWSHAGGQATIVNSNATFGDYAFASTGFRSVIRLQPLDEELFIPSNAANTFGSYVSANVDDLVDHLMNDPVTGYPSNATFAALLSSNASFANLTSRDTRTILIETADDLRRGQDTGTRYWIQTLFTANTANAIAAESTFAFNPALVPVFAESYRIIRDYLKIETITVVGAEATANDMIDIMFDTAIDVINNPTSNAYLQTFRSTIEAASHQFSYAGSGVNYNALPFGQKATGLATDPTTNLYTSNGGVVYATFNTEQGDTYLGPDLRVDFERSTIEGQAFSRGVQNIALPLIIGVGG